jgi:hypothetical protein
MATLAKTPEQYPAAKVRQQQQQQQHGLQQTLSGNLT